MTLTISENLETGVCGEVGRWAGSHPTLKYALKRKWQGIEELGQ